MTELKNSLRPRDNKQHDLGRDEVRWNKLWVSEIDSDGIIYNKQAILSQNWVFETTYGTQQGNQNLIPVDSTFQNPCLIVLPNIQIASAIIDSGLTYQFRLVVNGIEIPPSKTSLEIVGNDTQITFDGVILGQSINFLTDASDTQIVVWYIPDFSQM